MGENALLQDEVKRFPGLVSDAIATTKASCLALLQRRELQMRHTVHQLEATHQADPELTRLQSSEKSLAAKMAGLQARYDADVGALLRRVAEEVRVSTAMRAALARRGTPQAP